MLINPKKILTQNSRIMPAQAGFRGKEKVFIRKFSVKLRTFFPPCPPLPLRGKFFFFLCVLCASARGLLLKKSNYHPLGRGLGTVSKNREK